MYVSYSVLSDLDDYGHRMIAVYSADQADYTALAVQLGRHEQQYATDLVAVYHGGSQAKEASDVLKAQADTKYVEGDFAGAKTDYQAAIDKLNEANTANATLSTTTETGLMGLLSGADGVVNAYGDKLKGEASMDKNVGVFYIMLGVAMLLAGLARIMWAFSRLVDARGPAHHEHV